MKSASKLESFAVNQQLAPRGSKVQYWPDQCQTKLKTLVLAILVCLYTHLHLLFFPTTGQR